jgi:hypothetical protein
MKTFQARDFKNALIVLFCVSILLAQTATSAITGSNLHLEGIQKVAEAAGQSVARQGSGTFEPAERSILQNSRTTVAGLPSLEILAPNSKLNAVFPVIGLMAAVTVTQLLRRRRIAQLRSSASAGQ